MRWWFLVFSYVAVEELWLQESMTLEAPFYKKKKEVTGC